MTSISSLNKVHHLGQYGNFENKDEPSQKTFINKIKSVVKKNITPFYVYSYKKMRANYQTFSSYFKKVKNYKY